MKKKRILIIAAIVLVLAFAAAAIYAAWAHTTALELFPEGNWENVRLHRFLGDESDREVSPEALREVMSGQTLWRRGEADFWPNIMVRLTIDSQEWIMGVSEKYIQVFPVTEEGDVYQHANAWRFDSEMFYPLDVNISLGTEVRTYHNDGSFDEALRELYRQALEVE